jgi:NAD+ synthetase
MPVVDTAALIEERVKALVDYHQQAGITRAEIDVSGGVDSAVMLALLARALGPARVTAVFIGIHSGDDFLRRAIEAADATGVALVQFDATDLFESLHEGMLEALVAAGYSLEDIHARMHSDPAVNGSIRSCLRAPIGRGFNRLSGGGVRHGTGNECEDRFLRFYQKGGDGEVDTNPIGMLSKGEVFQLARALDVPRSIRAATPSPDLHGIGEAHNDEDELRERHGVHWTYSKIDPETGDYCYVGSIERMSRFLDGHGELFGPAEPDWQALADQACRGLFRPLAGTGSALELLQSARTIERQTRHKQNASCPMLGARGALVRDGILQDEFSEDLIAQL